MNEHTPPPAAPTESSEAASRRRFLKGTTLALPAVMTLNSTAARAQAAASSTCAAFPPTAPMVPCTTGPDVYYREKTPCYSKLTYNADGTCTAGTSPAYFQGLSATTRAPIWRQFPNGTPVSDADKKFINDPSNPKCVGGGASICFGYAVVHFDQTTGLPVAIGDQTPPPGTLLVSAAGECLNSLWGRTV